MKFLDSLMEFIYWCWIFLCPTIVFGIIGYALNYHFKGNIGIMLFVGLSVLGIGLGIYFAERIRRTVGCSMFMSRIYSWSDSNKRENE